MIHFCKKKTKKNSLENISTEKKEVFNQTSGHRTHQLYTPKDFRMNFSNKKFIFSTRNQNPKNKSYPKENIKLYNRDNNN